MKCVILQPSYIPWRGFFHQIQKADVFVFYDDVQYDTRGWRNRNRIQTANGPIWLTVPVRSSGAQITGLPIHDVEICCDQTWHRKHWASLQMSYSRAPFFERYAPKLREFLWQRPEFLVDLTIPTTRWLAECLGLGDKTFLRSSELGIEGYRTERLIRILRHVGADGYVSGPSAAAYLDEEAFRAAGISLEYMSYDYEPYEQLYEPFEPQVSVLDLLFLKGPDAGEWIWGRAGSSEPSPSG